MKYLSGWAPRLPELGMSVVVAPRWAVTDAAAYRFAETFYDVLTSAPGGKAVRRDRVPAQATDDPSWLPHAVYAYQLAQVHVVPISLIALPQIRIILVNNPLTPIA